MPSEVIERVNKIGSAEGQPKLLTFQDRHGYEKSDPDPYFSHLITRSKEKLMMNTSRTTTLESTKTEMPILLIKVKKNKRQQ